MSRRWRPGLRGLLALAFGGVALLAVATANLLTGRAAALQARTDAVETLRIFAASLADSLDREMFERWRDIRFVTNDPVLRNPDQPPEARRAVLRRVQESYPDYAIVAFMEPSGRVLVDSRRLAEGADASARTMFRRAMERPVVEDVHEAIVLARLLPRQADGLPPRFIDIAAPVLNDEEGLVGVVAAHLYWQWAEGLARRFREAVGPEKRVEPMIVSASGNVLLGPADLEGKPLPVAAAMPGGTARWPDEHDYLTASVGTRGHLDYPGLGWTVVVRQPVEIAAARASDDLGRVAGNAFVAALLAAPVGWLLAWWIARPLSALAIISKRTHLLDEEVHLSDGMAGAPYREAQSLAVAMRRLVKELREGERNHALLVREVDHRVKNSLQAVAAILGLQARRMADPAARATLGDAIARVRTVAEVHRALYLTDGPPGEQVDLGAMLRELCRQHAAGTLRPGVEIECEPGRVHLVEARRAMAVGLLVAELVTNAGKHAFPEHRTGTVQVAVREHNAALEVVVEDDGVGMAEATEGGGLGGVLVQRLARQAGGELDIASTLGRGTRAVLRMPRSA